MTKSPSRWPRWVYDSGNEPDPRWSFANERTFLAWIRTALALVAGGVALDAFEVPLDDDLKKPLTILLLTLGLGCALFSWARWAAAERAMRRGEPLPSASYNVALAAVVGLVALLLIVGLW